MVALRSHVSQRDGALNKAQLLNFFKLSTFVVSARISALLIHLTSDSTQN